MHTSVVKVSEQTALLARVGAVSRPASWPLVLGAVFSLIYLSTLTADYFWDGITFALQIEKVADGERSATLLFHQSHLLYNAFGYLLYRAINAVGVHARALTILQVTNAFLGAAALAVFFSVVRRMTCRFPAALIATAALAVFATWWKLATDADAYIPAVLLMLLCLRALVAERPRWVLAGLSLAAAMLMHELASLFSFAAVAVVFSSQTIRAKRRFAIGMLALAWTVSVAAYYVCAATLHGITDPPGVIRWATTNPSHIVPFTSPLPGLRQSPRASLDLVLGHRFRLFYAQAGVIEWLIALVACATLLALIWKVATAAVRFRRREGWPMLPSMIRERLRPHLLILSAWVFPYFLFLWFFEPEDAHLRLFYAPALALGLATWLDNSAHGVNAPLPTRKPAILLRAGGLAVLALGLFNLAFFILPHTKADSSLLIKKARSTQAAWDEQTVVFYLDHSEIDTTFEYFNRKSRWRRFAPGQSADFKERIREALSFGNHVWLNDGAIAALAPEQLAEFVRGDEIEVDLDYAAGRYVELRPQP